MLRAMCRLAFAYAVERLIIKPEKRWRSETIRVSSITADKIASGSITNIKVTTSAIRDSTVIRHQI